MTKKEDNVRRDLDNRWIDSKKESFSTLMGNVLNKKFANNHGKGYRPLGYVIGIAHTQVERVIKGKSNYTVENLLKVLNGLGLTIMIVPKSKVKEVEDLIKDDLDDLTN